MWVPAPPHNSGSRVYEADCCHVHYPIWISHAHRHVFWIETLDPGYFYGIFLRWKALKYPSPIASRTLWSWGTSVQMACMSPTSKWRSCIFAATTVSTGWLETTWTPLQTHPRSTPMTGTCAFVQSMPSIPAGLGSFSVSTFLSQNRRVRRRYAGGCLAKLGQAVRFPQGVSHDWRNGEMPDTTGRVGWQINKPVWDAAFFTGPQGEWPLSCWGGITSSFSILDDRRLSKMWQPRRISHQSWHK